MAHLLLDGTSGTFASAPYRAEYNEASIVDVRVEIDYDAYATAQALISRHSGASTTSPWQFRLSATTPIFGGRDSSDAAHSAVGSAFTLSPGTRTQLRAVCDTSSNVCRFYQRATGTALTSDSGWSQVGADVAYAGNDFQQPTETGLQIGATNTTGNALMADGKIYRAVIKKGATSGGTLVFDADFSDTTTWTFA